MSGSTAKAARRAEREASITRMEEALLQVHSMLHDEDELDPAKLHAIVHGALGVEDADVVTVAPLAQMLRFDQRFRQLLRTEGIVATYIAVDPHDRMGRRLISGGAAKLTGMVDRVMRRGSEVIAAEQAELDARLGVAEGTAQALAAEVDAEELASSG